MTTAPIVSVFVSNSKLAELDFDPALIRGQGFDGHQPCMSSRLIRVQAEIQKISLAAPYIHSASHVLNLVTQKSSTVMVAERTWTSQRNSKLLQWINKVNNHSSVQKLVKMMQMLRINNWQLSEKIQVMCFDTTSVNTGRLNEVCVGLEYSFGHEPQWLVCRHYILEKILSTVFTICHESSNSPDIPLFKGESNHQVAFFHDYWSQLKNSGFTDAAVTYPSKECVQG